MKIALACRVEKGRRESGDDRALLPGRILEAGSWAGEASLPCAAAVCDGCGGYAGGGLAAETALSVLEQTPPELSADIVSRGVVLTGGGALLQGIDQLLINELNVPVYVAENALSCVAEGTGIMLENLHLVR